LSRGRPPYARWIDGIEKKFATLETKVGELEASNTSTTVNNSESEETITSPPVEGPSTANQGKSEHVLSPFAQIFADPKLPFPIRRLAVLLALVAVGTIFMLDNYYKELKSVQDLMWTSFKSISLIVLFALIFVAYKVMPVIERFWASKAPFRIKWIPLIHTTITLCLAVALIMIWWGTKL
jgi:hypothetical protein